MRSFSNFCFNKVGAMLVSFLLGGIVSVKAQTLTTDVSKACDGEAIVLTATGYEPTVQAVNFYAIVGGTTKTVGAAYYKGGVATSVYDMTGEDVTFYAESQGSKVKTPNVTVTVNTDCPNKCHQSSTGEYINGTDFDVLPSNSSSPVSYKPAESATIESHFGDYDVQFKINECSDGRAVTNDVSSYLGFLPKDNASQYSNYYWVSGNTFSEINCAPFTFSFKMYGNSRWEPVWDEKYYRLAMKVYIVKQKGCYNCGNAQIKLETGSGSQGNFYENADHMEIIAYDDKTGAQLGEPFLVNKSFDAQNIGGLLCKSEFDDRLVRLEIHFYGKFTLANKNPNVWFSLSPRFQQLGCMKMAVDYVSAEIMSVCMDKSSSCIGENVTVVAAGFPYGANYVWEYQEGTQWKQLRIDGFDIKGTGYREVSIPVETIGKRNYRVYDQKTIGSSSEYINFSITGKNCEPLQPSDISGDDFFCVPGSSRFSVSPVDPNPDVTYTWSVKDPNGKVYFTDKFKYDDFGDMDKDTRGSTVTLTLKRDIPDGIYTLEVQPVKKVYYANGTWENKPAGTPIQKKVKVFKTANPILSLICEGCEGSAEADKQLCPTDKSQKIEATTLIDPNSPYYGNYVFNWEGANAKTNPAGGDAIVDLISPEVCEGTKKNHTVKVTVSVKIDDVNYCPTSDANTYKIKDVEKPKIQCTSQSRTETLTATECKKTVGFTFPSFTAGCTTHPTIKVELDFTPADGSAKVTKVITKESIAEGEIASFLNQAANKVQLPAGKGTIKYTVSDDCGFSDVCTQSIEVKDVTPPSVDCSKVADYTVKLSDVASTNCQASTGVSTKLPTIVAPKLVDSADPCGNTIITGVYEGRTSIQKSDAVLPYETEAYRRANYKKATATETPNDDPYEMGYTFILWSFTDASGNTSYCTQKVTVIDDMEPDVNCPDYTAIDDVDNQPGECGLSVEGLLAWMAEHNYKEPSAKDVCSGKGANITAALYYSDGGPLAFIKPVDYNKIIFYVDKTYTMVWRFNKTSNQSYVDANTYVDCTIEFTVRDTEKPKFDCSSLSIVRVTANKFKPKDKPYEYLDYATKNDVKVGANTYTGTLKSYFDDEVIKMLTPDMAEDNCTEDLELTAILEGPDDKGKDRTLEIKSTADLEKVLYGIGVTTITYTFKDKSGNETSCEQFIMVTAGTTPIPNCTVDYDTVYADSECKAVYELDKTKIPTAEFPVDVNGFYFNYRYAAISGLHFGAANGPSETGDVCADMQVFFPDNITNLNGKWKYKAYTKMIGSGPMATMEVIDLTPETLCSWASSLDTRVMDNRWENFLAPSGPGPAGAVQYGGTILDPANTYTDVVNFSGYPYKIDVVDSEGTLVKTVENPYTAEDVVPNIKIVPRRFGGDGAVIATDKKCDTDDDVLLCGSLPVKTQNNFQKSDLIFEGLTKGTYTMTFYFVDRKDGEQTAKCTRQIEVVDKISPTVTCGNWGATKNLEANENCEVLTSDVPIIKMPTASDLDAKDNCAALADLKVSVKREFEDGSLTFGDAALENPLKMGTTYIHYIVSDGSEYSTPVTCTQTFIVEDKMGPEFDCSTLAPITAYADKTCAAPYANVEENGLRIPYAKQDPCSPNPDATSKGIEGKATRSDGKSLSDPYELKDSPITITWTFEDGAEIPNKTICTQIVNVVDTMLPVFDCSQIEDKTYFLEYEECTAAKDKVRALLGDYTAEDNCSGNIAGVPYLYDEATGDTVALPSAFESSKDYLIIWKFTDEAKNVTICTQNLSVKDTVAPKKGDICPDDVVVDATEETGCSVDFDHLNLPTAESLAITDPCDGKLIPELEIRISMPGEKIEVVYGVENAKLASYPVGTHVAYWIYKDKAVPANSDTCVQNITILDKIKPILADCDDAYGKKYSFTVDAENCEYDPVKVNKLLVQPKAYDACDSYLSGDVDEEGNPLLTIDPIIERYDMDTTTTPATFTLYADGITKQWDEDNFKKGAHMLKWIFKDKAGNTATCEKYVYIIDATGPFFDCSKINPDTLRPEAKPGECVVEFGDLKRDVLSKLHYNAYDACSEDSIPGVLTLNGIKALPDEYTMQVGVTYKLLWMFKDEDGNATTCPQWILPSHRNPIDFDCSTLEPIAIKADSAECFASPDSVQKYLSAPETVDACAEDYKIIAKPFFISGADTISIDLETQKFATGDTAVHWMFLSIWNIHDTLWCRQPISVLGNKKFDINCDEVSPALKDTIEDCGPSASALAKVTIPFVPDPCADPDSSYYRRYGHGTRLDSTEANPVKMTDPYPLGDSKIQWVFTDFTGSVTDTCVQTVNVRTNANIVVDCDKLKLDTIKTAYEVPDGVCMVEASNILPDSADLVVPDAKHPCLDDVTIEVHSRRKGGKKWSDDYVVGVNWIEWIFIDTSHTTINDTLICEQPIQVGKDNATLFDCSVIKPIRAELSKEVCDTLLLNLKNGIPDAYDACGDFAGELINPILRRTSKLSLESPFGVGHDTIVWVYKYRSLNDSVVCRQPVHVLDSKEPIFDCSLLPDSTLSTQTGQCYLESKYIKQLLDSLKNVSFAKDACVDTILIPGKYDAANIPDVLKVGDTITIHWTFQNEDVNLSKKECDHWLTVIGDKAPIFDCNSLPLDTFKTYSCDTLLTANEIKTPYAEDACTGDPVEGVGVRLDGGELYGSYPAGVTTSIKWTFKSKYSTKDTFCIQDIVVLTRKEPIFDCSTLDTIRVASEEGECYADSSVVAGKLEDHFAKDACTGTLIKGVPSYNDGPLPKKYMVGDTTLIKWTFIDSSLTTTAKICYQPVIVTGDQKPIFDCKSLASDPILIEGCDTTLSEQTIKTPNAEDACTHDSVPGVGRRLDGGDLYGVYPVGTTTIRWVFVSPFSSEKDSCDQDITILTKKEIVFDCVALADDTIKVNVATGECQAEATLPTQVAQHPCPEQSGVTEIKGIPTFNGEPLVANADSSEWKITLPTGIWNVTWTFTDHSVTMVDSIKSCDQPVRVGDVNEMPVDCNNYPDTLIKLSPNDCDLTWSEINFKQPEVVDLCSNTVIEPELTRWSGKSMDDPFVVGLDTVYWSYSFSGQDLVCKQAIHVLDSVAPIFDCSSLADIELYAKDGTCEVSSEELVEALGSHAAIDSCTKVEIPGKAYVDDVLVENVSAKVGDTLKVHWVFIDSMINAVAKECDQYVYVYGQNKPIFDCESLKDTILYLTLDECEFDGTKLNLNIPVAKDSCTGIPVPGVASRQDGEPMTAVFKKGVTVIDWTFKSPLSTGVRTCAQNVVVKDTLPPVVDCTILKDTIKVRITSESVSDNSVTAEEAKAAGLVVPSVTDKCDGEIVAVGHREDGKSMDDSYLLNTKTKVVWVYTDASGNSDSCSQVVVVEDWVVDDLICPRDINEAVQCVENLPAAYATYAEFKLAGGEFSNESKIVEGSFKVLTDEVPTDEHCDFYVVRTYQVTDVRNNDIQCKQKIHVVDNVAPSLSDAPNHIKLACTDEIPVAMTITADDDCLPTPVDVKFSESSTRGNDPNSCDYYNYTITRVWTAEDRCENRTSHTQYVTIVDTMAPEFTFPKDWKDTVLSIYNKGCTFGVPDFTVEVKSIVSDNCTDITNIKVYQTPEAHTLIKASLTVKVYVEDMCGNRSSLDKYVLVPQREEIVTVTAFDTALCADDRNPLTLWSQQVRLAKGDNLVEDWDGSYTYIPTAFVYDCYLDTVAESHLVYSNNPNTYMNKFSSRTLGSSAMADSVKNARINLRKQSQSGHYYFVAMDTLTLCSDTANSFLEIKERPRITMGSGLEKVCEFNGVDSVTLNSYLRCVDDKGGVITKEGWLLNGVDYKYGDSIFIQQDSSSFIYYAENECGRSTSIDTYYDFCIGDSIPTTHKDTMKLLGADSIYYYLFRTDDYKVRDSIMVDVYDRLRSDEIFVTVNEKENSTIWLGDQVKLSLHSNYGRLLCQWYAVKGKFDRRFFVGEGDEHFVFDDVDDIEDEVIYESYIHNGQTSIERGPRDTTAYYVVLSNEVCPSISGNVVTVNVNDKLPTAITPFTVDGMNDVFMKSFPVKIFNRYSQLIFEGMDGWDGSTNGEMADPGVYFYEVAMRDGTVLQGTIEIVLLK